MHDNIYSDHCHFKVKDIPMIKTLHMVYLYGINISDYHLFLLCYCISNNIAHITTTQCNVQTGHIGISTCALPNTKRYSQQSPEIQCKNNKARLGSIYGPSTFINLWAATPALGKVHFLVHPCSQHIAQEKFMFYIFLYEFVLIYFKVILKVDLFTFSKI